MDMKSWLDENIQLYHTAKAKAYNEDNPELLGTYDGMEAALRLTRAMMFGVPVGEMNLSATLAEVSAILTHIMMKRYMNIPVTEHDTDILGGLHERLAIICEPATEEGYWTT